LPYQQSPTSIKNALGTNTVEGAENMETNKRYRTPDTGEDIRKLLTVVGLPIPDREGLMAISQTEGRKFAIALTKVANKESDTDVQRDYLSAVVNGAIQSTRDSLAIISLPVPTTPTLIELSKREGKAFINALRIVEQESGDRQGIANARAYLENLIDEYGGGDIVTPKERTEVRAPAVHSVRPIARNDPDDLPDLGVSQMVRPAPVQPRPVPEKPARNKGTDDSASEYGKSYKVYGEKSAVCFAETMTRTGGVPTITIEFANALNGESSYDWKNKWSIQLTPAELYLVYGLLMGLQDDMTLLEIKGHGTNNEKSLKITYQGNLFFMVMFCRGKPPRAVPVLAKDIAVPIVMVGQQIIAGTRTLTWDMLGAVVKRVCSMHGNQNIRSTSERSA